MKTTNNFRKCPYCPHHQDQKTCCCRRIVSSRPKNKSKKTKKPQSAISQINTTLPVTVSNFEAMPSIMAQNSILRNQNDYLKRELSHNTQYHSNISKTHYNSAINTNNASSKDSPITTIFPQNSENDSSRTHYLQDKLYLSNKKLQEVLLQIDYLSKLNKNLNEANTKLQVEAEQLKIENDELREQLNKIRKKYKKKTKDMEGFPNKNQIENLLRNNEQLEKEIYLLRDECSSLRQNENKLRNEIVFLEAKINEKGYDGFSPQWVAHTSTKINALQKNISRLEEENNGADRSILFFDNFNNSNKNATSKNIVVGANENLSDIKYQIITAIKALKTKTQAFQFSQTLSQLISTDYTPLLALVKSLCESLLEPIMSSYISLQKQLQRKMKIYEIKFQKTVQRMHNMVIKIQNDRLRARAFSRGDSYY